MWTGETTFALIEKYDLPVTSEHKKEVETLFLLWMALQTKAMDVQILLLTTNAFGFFGSPEPSTHSGSPGAPRAEQEGDQRGGERGSHRWHAQPAQGLRTRPRRTGGRPQAAGGRPGRP